MLTRKPLRETVAARHHLCDGRAGSRSPRRPRVVCGRTLVSAWIIPTPCVCVRYHDAERLWHGAPVIISTIAPVQTALPEGTACALVGAMESDRDQGESHKGSVKFPYRDQKVCVKESIFAARCPRGDCGIMRPLYRHEVRLCCHRLWPVWEEGGDVRSSVAL